ncbi:MAG: hypothetical protein EBU33_09285, partial [Sphingobacteriia bacterium]|nr:hypothetical protein [Sphingobacteriia bacterium]
MDTKNTNGLEKYCVAPKEIEYPSLVLYYRPSCPWCVEVFDFFGKMCQKSKDNPAVYNNAKVVAVNITEEKQNTLLVPLVSVPHFVIHLSPTSQIEYPKQGAKDEEHLTSFLTENTSLKGGNAPEIVASVADEDSDENADAGLQVSKSSDVTAGDNDNTINTAVSGNELPVKATVNKQIRFNSLLTIKQPRIKEFLTFALYHLRKMCIKRFGEENADLFEPSNAKVFFVGWKPDEVETDSLTGGSDDSDETSGDDDIMDVEDDDKNEGKDDEGEEDDKER